MKGDIHPMELMARKEDWSEGVSLYARQEIEGVQVAYAAPLTMEIQEQPPAMTVRPFTVLTIQSAQQLMDELWHCGLRPSRAVSSAGQLQATQQHLADMQKIAFKKLGIE